MIHNVQQSASLSSPSSPSSLSTHYLTSYSTQLFGKSKKKQSMAQKRKKRGKKFAPKPLSRPDILETIPSPDEWKKTQSTDEQVQSMQENESSSESEEVKSQAAALIDTQRKSVEVLTYVKQQVVDLPRSAIVESISSPSGCDKVFNEFLGVKLSNEIRKEAMALFEDDKMELDLKAGLCSGEYGVAIKGGQGQYADCPRVTEFVVSLTRHLTGLINNSLADMNTDAESGTDTDTDNGDDSATIPTLGFALDETASMAGLKTFSRKARLSSMALLTGKDIDAIADDDLTNANAESQRPFQYVIDTKNADTPEDEVDYRKVTALYFVTPENWDKSCGGGITVKEGEGDDEREIYIRAKNDRLVILSSDTCLHRMEEWTGGKDGQESGSVIITHFVEKVEK